MQSVFQCAFRYIPSPNIDWISSMLLLHCIQPSPGQRSPLESMRDLYLARSFSTYYEAYIWSFSNVNLILHADDILFQACELWSWSSTTPTGCQSNYQLDTVPSITPRCNSCQLAQRNLFQSTALFPRDSNLGVANFKQFVLVQLIHSKTVKCHLGLIDCRLYLAPSPVRHQIYKTANLPKLYYCSIACGIRTGQLTV